MNIHFRNNPALRFSEFADDWNEKKFQQIFKRLTSKNLENNTNVLTISAQQGLINQEDFFNKSVAAKDLTGYYLLHEGDFAYNKSYSKGYPMGAIKKLKYYDSGVVSTLYICFRLKENNDQEFFEQYFEAGKQNHELQKVAQEGARNHGLLNIALEDFFNIKLIVPEYAVQKKIAIFLQKVDMKIKLLEKKLGFLKKFKKGVMQKIFSQELRFRDEGGKEYLKWNTTRLFETGRIVTGTTPSTLVKGYYNGPYPWITPSDIDQRREVQISERTLSELGFKKSRAIQRNSLLVTCIASIGKNVILKRDGSCNQQINAITPNKKHDVTFLYYLVEKNKKTLVRYACGGGMLILNKNDFSHIRLQIPVLDEQQKIANFLSNIDDKIDLEERRLSEAKRFKKFLLQNMFV